MYTIYAIILIILLLLLLLLLKEEKEAKDSIIHGLVSKYWILRERRRYIRFDEELKVRYDLKRKPVDASFTKTANISRKGLCLLAYEKLRTKSYLDLEIDLPGFSKPIKVTGQIVWTKDLQARDAEGRRLFYMGIRFARINPEFEAMLLTHLNTLKLPS